MKIKRLVTCMAIASMTLLLTGCNKKIFIEKAPDYAVQVDVADMARDIFYVKDGTKFASVYLPMGNAMKETRKLDTSRVLYFCGDEDMVPVYYKGECLAYKSAETELLQKGISAERFKDMGYSIGIYGGEVQGDGYYHISASKNVAEGSNAQEVLAHSQVDEVRIVSIGGKKPSEIVDANTGVIMGLEKDKTYTVEFYVGTYYYTYNFVCDTHFLGAYEYYYYDGSNVQDTKLTYMAFESPDDWKSGYYNVNGSGIFLYHNFAKGEADEGEDLNISYYTNEADQILQYTKQYVLNVPVETRDLSINVQYGNVTDELDSDIEVGAYLISPEQTIYEMQVSKSNNLITMSLQTAMPGEWTINIYPRSLLINDIEMHSDVATEDAICEEKEFTLEEGADYKAIYADIEGEGEVYGSIVADDGRTYQLDIVYYKDVYKEEQRYMVYFFPHIQAGTYKVQIYHYQSETSIGNIKLMDYDPTNNELIVSGSTESSDDADE